MSDFQIALLIILFVIITGFLGVKWFKILGKINSFFEFISLGLALIFMYALAGVLILLGLTFLVHIVRWLI